jgi:hypothetical protein
MDRLTAGKFHKSVNKKHVPFGWNSMPQSCWTSRLSSYFYDLAQLIDVCLANDAKRDIQTIPGVDADTRT